MSLYCNNYNLNITDTWSDALEHCIASLRSGNAQCKSAKVAPLAEGRESSVGGR